METMLLGGLSVLTGCVAHLYHSQKKQYQDIQTRSDECDDDRRKLWLALAKINPESDVLKD